MRVIKSRVKVVLVIRKFAVDCLFAGETEKILPSNKDDFLRSIKPIFEDAVGLQFSGFVGDAVLSLDDSSFSPSGEVDVLLLQASFTDKMVINRDVRGLLHSLPMIIE